MCTCSEVINDLCGSKYQQRNRDSTNREKHCIYTEIKNICKHFNLISGLVGCFKCCVYSHGKQCRPVCVCHTALGPNPGVKTLNEAARGAGVCGERCQVTPSRRRVRLIGMCGETGPWLSSDYDVCREPGQSGVSANATSSRRREDSHSPCFSPGDPHII